MSEAPKVKGPASSLPSIEKTYGKPIDHWKALIRGRAGAKHMEFVNWLKFEHGLGQGLGHALVAHTLSEPAD